MPNQTTHGSAFEYSVLIRLPDVIQKWCQDHYLIPSYIKISKDHRFEEIEGSFFSIPETLQNTMLLAASAGIIKIIQMEPRLLFGKEDLPIDIQVNQNLGEGGDVRDILLFTQKVENCRLWELGISCKWNHKALKHSRLSNTIDFGYKWLGHPCSEAYWQYIQTPLHYLEEHRGQTWRSLNSKVDLVYKPIMTAFMVELKKLAEEYPDTPGMLVEYLVGRYDFYKIIGKPSFHRTEVQAYNLHGSLNKKVNQITPLIQLDNQLGGLPTSLVDVRWKDNSSNTIQVILDQGWQFNFRIHNADTLISPSVKFDINFAGHPVAYYVENW